MEDKIYHIIYKTICLVTGNFYIGMHSTNNLEDGYMGSGKRLANSINKYGKDNHKTEILEVFNNREELSKREKELVNEELIKNPKCMNIVHGGEGGYNIKAVESNRLKKGKSYEEIFKTPEMVEHRRQLAKDNYHKSIKKYNFKNIETSKHSIIAKKGAIAQKESGYAHSGETKAKIKESNKNRDWSERNSKEYRDKISLKTKEAMSKLDNKELQRKALEGRLLFWKNKREAQIIKIIELQKLNYTPEEVMDKLNMSKHVYYSRIKEMKIS
jgi:hypothetical protein